MMNNFVPFEKLSKKEQRRINGLKRKTWEAVNPVTKVVTDKTKYSRKAKHKNRANDCD